MPFAEALTQARASSARTHCEGRDCHLQQRYSSVALSLVNYLCELPFLRSCLALLRRAGGPREAMVKGRHLGGPWVRREKYRGARRRTIK